MYLLTLLLEDLVRLLYLRTSGRTEEFTLTRPCVNLKKKVRSKSKIGFVFLVMCCTLHLASLKADQMVEIKLQASQGLSGEKKHPPKSLSL